MPTICLNACQSPTRDSCVRCLFVFVFVYILAILLLKCVSAREDLARPAGKYCAEDTAFEGGPGPCCSSADRLANGSPAGHQQNASGQHLFYKSQVSYDSHLVIFPNPEQVKLNAYQGTAAQLYG